MRVPHIKAGTMMGFVDKVVGLGREIAGELSDREALKKSGRLQQEKGSARLDALQSEIKADAQNAKVKTLGKA